MYRNYVDDYNPHGIHFHIHRDEYTDIERARFYCALRIAIVELDGVFLAIKAIQDGIGTLHSIEAFETLKNAEEYLDEVEERFLISRPEIDK